MVIELKIAKGKDREEWDRLVESSPHGTIFHTWKWLKITEKHTKSKLYPIIGYKGTTPIGIFPLFYQKKFLVKTVFSPPPHTGIPHLGPALVDYDKLKQDKKESVFIEFQKQVDEFIYSKIKPNYVFISSSPGLIDSRPFKWTGYQVEPVYDYLVDLGKGMDYVWKEFKKPLRDDIKKAEKSGVCMEEGSKEELCFVYDSSVRRYQEQSKMINLPLEYLLDLYDSFYPRNLRIFVARYHEELVGGIIATCYRDKISFWIGAAKPNLRNISPNDLVQWEAMKWASEQGFRYYEEIGAGVERLCRYKSKYNPDLSVYFSVRKYSSFMFKWLETSYIQILKPIYAKFKLMGRSK